MYETDNYRYDTYDDILNNLNRLVKYLLLYFYVTMEAFRQTFDLD